MRRSSTAWAGGWRPLGLAILALGLALTISACGRRPGLYADPSPAAAQPAPTVQVLQGDVLVIDGRHLRLADTAVPQPAPGAHCLAEAAAARQARLRLQELAQGVRHAEVLPTGGHDGDDRAEARVRLDGQDPSQVLIDEGLAVPSGAAPIDWCGPISSTLSQGQHIAMLSLSGS